MAERLKKDGFLDPKVLSIDINTLLYQVPGGMLSNLMNQLKQQGIAVMFVSSELPEVLGIADRVIVMCDGQITGEVMARETTQNEILTLATRFENKMAAGQ